MQDVFHRSLSERRCEFALRCESVIKELRDEAGAICQRYTGRGSSHSLNTAICEIEAKFDKFLYKEKCNGNDRIW